MSEDSMPRRDVSRVLRDHATSWSPIVDLSLKVLGLAWVVMSFTSSILLNDYLASIGQMAVPIDFTGSWGSLMIIGGLLTGALVGMAVLFTSAQPLMKSAHEGGAIPFSSRIVFFFGGIAGLVSMLTVASVSSSLVLVLGLAVLTGLVSLGLSVRVMRVVASYEAPAPLALHGAAWVLIAALTSSILIAELMIVFGSRMEDNHALALAVIVTAAPHLLCFAKSRALPVGVVAVGITWLVAFVSPGHRIIIMLALYALHLGGGIEAAAVTSAGASTICNLGTVDRPVLYYSAAGCTRQVALARRRDMSRVSSEAVRGDLVACWRRSIARGKEGCVVSVVGAPATRTIAQGAFEPAR